MIHNNKRAYRFSASIFVCGDETDEVRVLVVALRSIAYALIAADRALLLGVGVVQVELEVVGRRHFVGFEWRLYKR